MTARFLLHLRMWEAQNSVVQATPSTAKPSPMEFARNPNGTNALSLVDEFGEDPVHRAHQMRSVRDLFEGEVMDNFGEGFVPRTHQNASRHDTSAVTASNSEDYT